MKRALIFSLFFVLSAMTSGMVQGNITVPTRPGVSEIFPKGLIRQFSLDEKLALVTGVGFSLGEPLEGADPFIPGVAGYTRAMPEHGLPSLLLADGPAGLRFGRDGNGKPVKRATAFPIATAIASTWDRDLAEEFGRALGQEARSYGIGIVFGPGINIQRDPLGGRNYEYLSEDPLLTGLMAGSIVTGLEAEGVGATLKHYVANNQETNRTALDTRVDEETLRRIYLRAFRLAISEGDPTAVMTAYNLVNGTHTSQDEELVNGILRQEFGFKGIIMTDWFSGDDPVAQIHSGNNLIMPGLPSDRAAIAEAIERGRLSEAALDRALEPTLKALRRQEVSRPLTIDWERHRGLARRMAAEGAVLLKNDGVLPFTQSDPTAALFGVGGYDTIIGGTGSGDVAEWLRVSIADGLKAVGWKIDRAIADQTEAHIRAFYEEAPTARSIFDPVPYPDQTVYPSGDIALAAQRSDLGIVVVSRTTGEFRDRNIQDDFDLSKSEQKLVVTVSEAFRSQGKPTLVILNVGGPIEVASWIDSVDAVLVSWLGGQEAGHAVADLIVGAVNPSGRLTASWPRRYNDVSTAPHFPGSPTTDEPIPAYAGFGSALPSKVRYKEKLRVGYRHFDQSGDSPMFPFGYGLSYTDFVIDETSIAVVGDELVITAVVKNKGLRKGKTVLQVFAASDSSQAPIRRELIGFAKSIPIQPGATHKMNIRIRPNHIVGGVILSSVSERSLRDVRIEVSTSSSKVPG